MTYSLPMILKAIASNQIARFAPGLYVRLTGQTGRGGSSTETAIDIAQHFRQCLIDYLGASYVALVLLTLRTAAR